jgi:hypothetical protein
MGDVMDIMALKELKDELNFKVGIISHRLDMIDQNLKILLNIDSEDIQNALREILNRFCWGFQFSVITPEPAHRRKGFQYS